MGKSFLVHLSRPRFFSIIGDGRVKTGRVHFYVEKKPDEVQSIYIYNLELAKRPRLFDM